MTTLFTAPEFRYYINPAFPDRPQRLPNLTNDELMCAFLATHGVDVQPVGADIRMSRGEAAVMGTAFGLLNPVAWDTVATGSQMKQDARIAARQEWTSWKQWTLGHADWPTFKEEAGAKYRSALALADSWESDPDNQEAFRKAIADGKAAAAAEAKRTGFRWGVGLAVVIVISCGVDVIRQIQNQQQQPQPAAVEIPENRGLN